MMRRTSIVLGVLVVLGAAGVWWWARSAPPAPAATSATAQSQPAAALTLRLEVMSAGPDDDAVATVRVYDAGAARRDTLLATEKAAGREWRGSTRTRILNAPAATPPSDWPTLVTMTVTNASGTANVPIAPATGATSGTATFVLKARAGDRLTASLPFGGQRVASNVVVIPALADGRARTIAQGRVAEILGRADAMRAAADALLAADANSPWGDYFRGAALEAAGDRAGARSAFERALTHSAKSSEPPMGLMLRIERLK